MRCNRKMFWKHLMTTSGFSQPSIYHALVVIFLEFFAWGLVTSPIISVLNKTFPDHTFLMNGLIQGVKGMLSFLSAPLIGALSDVWGRKPFLVFTVAFTCAPIPLMRLSPWWYFAMISISGVFAVTFSVVFAYVADVTSEEERSAAYGLVSATFAASLVTSPAIGAYLGSMYSESLVIWIASAVALLDVLFIMVAVPESLPEKLRPASWGSQISWDKADPFGSLRKVGQDNLIMLLCVTVFLSYLPEAGEYSCFFVYLRNIMGFSVEETASFIAVVGVLSVLAQTLILALIMKYLGPKQAILFGLVFEVIQLTCYGFGSQTWVMWCAGGVAAMSSITYPAISSFVSAHASADQQGVAQGIVTGIRGLCNGLGPAVFGFIFYLFHVDISANGSEPQGHKHPKTSNNTFNPLPKNFQDRTLVLNACCEMDYSGKHLATMLDQDDCVSIPALWIAAHIIGVFNVVPGPPFAFGAVLVILALLVAVFLPDNPHGNVNKSSAKKVLPVYDYQKETGVKKHEEEPLMEEPEADL